MHKMDTCKYSTNIKDYKTIHEYYAALEYNSLIGQTNLNDYNKKLLERCEFILESKSLAAKYLKTNGDFLFGIAIKEHFDVAFGRITEASWECYSLEHLLLNIAKKNSQRALEVWLWVIREFYGYSKYSGGGPNIVTWILGRLYMFPDRFSLLLAAKLEKDHQLCDFLVGETTFFWECENVFRKALQKKYHYTIKSVLNHGLSLDAFETKIIEEIWSDYYSTPQATKKLFCLLYECAEEDIEKEEKVELAISFINNKIQTKKQEKHEKLHPSKVTPLITETYERFISACEEIKANGEMRFDYIQEHAEEEFEIYIEQDFSKPSYIALEFASGEDSFQQVDTNIFSVKYRLNDYKKLEFLSFCYNKNLSRSPNFEIFERWQIFERFREKYNKVYALKGLKEISSQVLYENEAMFKKMKAKYKSIRNDLYYRNKEYTKLYEDIYVRLLEDGSIETKWKNEFLLYSFIKHYYPDTVYQYKSDWLGKQSIDIYIPAKNVGIEYQGRQHYEPIDYFGGEEAFKENIKRDERKKKLCEKNGVKLLYWKYDIVVDNTKVTNFIKEFE